MNTHNPPATRQPHAASPALRDDAQERYRAQHEDDIVEQSDDDAPRDPPRKGSVPVSER
jgi:hypothetical protein